jgi:outer membrane protein assembly factor BamE (lipoprotein component of BamABCDE complex)
MTARFCIFLFTVLLTGCAGDTGLRCEYSAGNLDAVKAQVATLKAGGTTASEVINSLGKPTSVAPVPEGGKTFEYNFVQALSSSSSPGCPPKSQKVTFIFDSRQILQSMQVNF